MELDDVEAYLFLRSLCCGSGSCRRRAIVGSACWLGQAPDVDAPVVDETGGFKTVTNVP
ncbi:hypothetical protein [Burkholderia ubonensis]|uniref:hypothetical protein n=1 Tax=Burkholderia ubonensis TaxID=101571 RepID=UPI000AD35D19|nr:hypothetical protein [Burkholderia ubonensis]